MTGASLVIALYFTIMMVPLVPIGIFFTYYYGLSLHLLIPVLWTATLLVQFLKKRNSTKDFVAFASGLSLTVVICYLYPFIFQISVL